MVTATVDRTFDIDIETMWRMWTDADHAARWLRPSLDEFSATIATIDARPGGTYRLEMIHRNGETHATSGRFLEVDQPTRLVFTWSWDGSGNESRVEVTLTDRGDERTTVAIRHTRLPSQQEARRHTEGWIGCLDSLAHTH